MLDRSSKIARLVTKYLDGSIDAEELVLLNQWRNESPENEDLFQRLLNDDYLFEQIAYSYPGRKQLFSKIREQIEQEEAEEMLEAGGSSFLWRKVLVAASVVLLLAIGAYWLLVDDNKEATVADTQPAVTNDVAPGKYKAKLTLSDGTVVILDSAHAQKKVQDGDAALTIMDGKVVYDAGANTNKVLYHTLSTAVGESFATELSDGTKVWLNSESSITYPVSFVGNARPVSMKGEAYFEVAKDARRPFTVSVDGPDGKACEIGVVGTHFNIMAYADEPLILATLLEGAITVKKDNATRLLAPGQQALLNAAEPIKIVSDVNTDVVTAWKDQTFYFKSDDLRTILKHLGRWYGIEVEYKENVPNEKFSGMISRNKNLSEVLRMLEQSSDLHFDIQGNKVMVGLRKTTK